MTTALIQVENLEVHRYHRQLLHGINLTLSPREVITIIGPNGAGKSTLIKVILGQVKPTKGSVLIKPKIKMGYVPQRFNVRASLPIPVKQFLTLAIKSTDQFDSIVKDTGIESILQSPLHGLSGGELQRVLLARALLSQPDVLILDEPAQGVDINGQLQMYELITSLKNKYQCGVVMVSHDLHFVMASTDKVICINQHMCCSGHPEEVSQHPEYLALFQQVSGEVPNEVAVYTHQHNHCHDVSGYVIPNHQCGHDHD